MTQQPALPHVLAAPGSNFPTLADFYQLIWWLVLLKVVIVFAFLLLTTIFMIWFERRVIGRMQNRPGPNRAGPFGLLQPIADALKLPLKEDIIPTTADRMVFIVAPLISAGVAFVGFAVIPWGPEVSIFHHYTPLQLADLPVAVLLILAMSSVGVYGIVLAGWASSSPYSLLGALRSAAQVISYEIAMALAFVAVFLYAGSLETTSIVVVPAERLVLLGAAGLVRDLPVHHGRGDQPAAVRPAGGRGRAGRRVPHRVLLDEVRHVLPRRVHQHDHGRRAGHHAVPRRLAGPVAASRCGRARTATGGRCCGS